MSTANRVIKNTGYLYAKMGITMFVSLYTTRLILNGLGASDFGIFNIVGGAIAMLGFLNAAMASATQRFMSYAEGEGNKEKQKYIFNISIVLHAAIALIVGLVLVGAGWFFFNGILTIPDNRVFAAEIVYASLIVSTMFTVMSVPYDAVLNAHENMKYYALVGILESFLKLAVAFACVYATSDKLIVYGVLMACIPFVTLSIMRIYCHRHYEECILAPRRYYSQALMKEMTGFAGWNLLGVASNMVGNYGMGIALNHFFGALLNAALGIANQLNGQLLVFSNSMLKAVNPVITKSEGSGQRQQMIEQSTTACKFAYIMLAVIAIPAIIEMPYILKLWLKNVPEWTVVFAQLQIVRTLIEQTNIAYGTSIYSVGHIKRYNQVMVVVNLLPILLISFIFKNGGSPIFFYIINISIWGFVFAFVRIYFMKRYCSMKYQYFNREIIFRTILSSLLIFALSIIPSLFMKESFIRLWTTTIVSVVVSFPIIWFLCLNRKETDIFIKILNEFITKNSSKKRDYSASIRSKDSFP